MAYHAGDHQVVSTFADLRQCFVGRRRIVNLNSERPQHFLLVGKIFGDIVRLQEPFTLDRSSTSKSGRTLENSSNFLGQKTVFFPLPSPRKQVSRVALCTWFRPAERYETLNCFLERYSESARSDTRRYVVRHLFKM